MHPSVLRRHALAFREGILNGRQGNLMCFAVCAPLSGFLSAAYGIDTSVVEADFGFVNHCWLRLGDGSILDPTADQFRGRLAWGVQMSPGPAVYLGKLPTAYRHWVREARRNGVRTAGARARKVGVARGCNPFPVGGWAYTPWNQGWDTMAMLMNTPRARRGAGERLREVRAVV